ncbi:TetR/AcrR family transcriptional regulator [Aurantimonas sp. VKM B-3413]|uniref:TetR/AcrR family transcriptional regulator n=1 Tax=Aurantimonas sp. VKM B-3413 TaxID=2779401 RepID=UPI001E5261A0|nr:TetR/AcrR family transcriptional regulator [Aurantimonas sp. VKM B-3413]MCB8836988.1 TetR/AcrR family transcriptional regulator [Aurantimonas sp. VKM B-3413]
MSAISSAPQTPPAERVQPSAHEERQAHILMAARSCFARAGFHGASMQQICAEAKMSPGALYRYFPSKDSIIEAIAEEERVQAAECMAALSSHGPLVDRITQVGVDYLRQIRDDESGGLMVEICSESLRNTSVGQRFKDIEMEVRGAMLSALRRGQEMGEVDPAIDLEVVLTVLFAVGDGLVMRLQFEPTDPETIRPYLRRVVAGLLAPGAPGE